MATLTDEQQAQVKSWADGGANLNQIQDQLRTESGVNLTYLDVRLLLVDLGITLKDNKPKAEEKNEEAPPAELPSEVPGETEVLPPEGGAGQLKIDLDEIAIPSMLVSGKVTFSDGQMASWYVDQMGRLGLKGPEAGYRPPEADVPLFQQQLDQVLMKKGF